MKTKELKRGLFREWLYAFVASVVVLVFLIGAFRVVGFAYSFVGGVYDEYQGLKTEVGELKQRVDSQNTEIHKIRSVLSDCQNLAIDDMSLFQVFVSEESMKRWDDEHNKQVKECNKK